MIKNILLKIKYDGTQFSGWQRQPHVKTVQGEIERVLSILCADDIQINGTSRTDAGVHAIAQQANFIGEYAIPTENILRAANNLLDPAVQITEVAEVPIGFHARFDCKGKQYEYRILNTREKNPFDRNFAYFVDRKLDYENMKKALNHIKGTHDFKCFQAAGGEEKETTVRTIFDIGMRVKPIKKEDETETNINHINKDSNFEMQDIYNFRDSRWFEPNEIVINVSGDGFLYNMVRIIVGTLVDVGLGRIEPNDLKNIIESRDRTLAGHTAPSQGLYLKEIYY